jgi:diaminopimelate decarboxylase
MDLSHDAPTWWIRPGLEAVDGRLIIAGRDAEALAREHGTPLYVHDMAFIESQVRAVREALRRTGMPVRVRFALKSQRRPEIMALVRGLGAPGTPDAIGVDCCSPGEVAWALAHGWRADELSYTGTNVSDADFRAILEHPEIQLNVDLPSQLRRIGRLAPGRKVGLRINPRVGAARPYRPVGYGEDETVRFGEYAGGAPTKFGFYPEQLDEALAIAAEHDLTIDCVHFHLCHQMLTDDLPKLDHALAEASKVIRRLLDAGCPIEEINTGGGLGEPLHQGDTPLDLNAWAATLRRGLGEFADGGITIATEPGEFFFGQSGVLLAEVITVEDRMGTTFVGLDAGWNIMGLRFIWGEWVECLTALDPLAPRPQRICIAGHINEAPDLFAEDYPFPPVIEGDIVALLNVGSYCQGVTSEHCLRPAAKAVFLTT